MLINTENKLQNHEIEVIHSNLRTAYFQECEQWAKDILEESTSKEYQEQMLNDISDNQTTYVVDCLKVLRYTNNDSEYQNWEVDLSDYNDVSDVYKQIAMYALRQDIQDAIDRINREKVSCDSCQQLVISGILCHETNCPNMGKIKVDGEWIELEEEESE